MGSGERTLFREGCSLDTLNAMSRGTAMEPLGILFTEIGPDFLRATMPVDARTKQPYGLLHGGASVLLAETLGSSAGMWSTAEGDGVVGQFPRLEPGGEYSYNSCHTISRNSRAEGAYFVQGDDGTVYFVRIPGFDMELPQWV